MFEPVWRMAASQIYPSVPARLEGFRRHSVRGELYPALVRSPVRGTHVVGRLYRNVFGCDLERLDDFEGTQYRRISVTVEDLANGDRIPAEVYLFLREDLILDADWDPQRFAGGGIDAFMRGYGPTT